MLKISCFSCWRFFNCELSHRYVMKMYCPSITILGYTSQSRKFEKLISIHLNKKMPIFRSSHQRCSIKTAPKNLAIFTTRKHLWWSLFLIKLLTLRRKKTEIQGSQDLWREESFLGEVEGIFHGFYGAVDWWEVGVWWKIADTSFNNKIRSPYWNSIKSELIK